MNILMRQTLTESINGGRTTQAFVKGSTYPVPDDVGQLWIGRGWATAASAAAGEMSGTSETGGTRQSKPVAPLAPVSPVSHPTRKE